MKITTLGTSHGGAEKNRFCSSTMVQTGGAIYLIDAGAPVEALLVNRDEDLSTIRGVFITHMHDDHVSMLSPIVKSMQQYHKVSRATVMFPETMGMYTFYAWLKAMHFSTDDRDVHQPLTTNRIRFQSAEENGFFQDEHVTVSAIRTQHISPEIPSYAYVMEAEGKRILFTGDLRGDLSDFPEIAFTEPFDLIVCELTHYPLDLGVSILRRCRTRRMLFTHVSNKDNRLEQLLYRMEEFPFDVGVARDGAEYTI